MKSVIWKVYFLSLIFLCIKDSLEFDKSGLKTILEINKFFKMNNNPVCVELIFMGEMCKWHLGFGLLMWLCRFIRILIISECSFGQGDKHSILILECIVALNSWGLDKVKQGYLKSGKGELFLFVVSLLFRVVNEIQWNQTGFLLYVL